MKINMQYPDGSKHDIRPSNLVDIGNNIYVLEYYDETLSSNMQTILINENGSFAKQPLKQYGIGWIALREYSKKKGKQENISILPQTISCKNPITDYNFISSHFLLSLKGIVGLRPETISNNAILIYHNLFDDEYYWDENCNSLIDGGLKSLTGYNYEIQDVNVRTRMPQRPNPQTRAATTIYFNETDGKYYYDEKCSMEISGGLETLGYVMGDYIRGKGDIDYRIKKVNVKKEQKKYLYDHMRETFYLNEEDAKKLNLIGNLFSVSYIYSEDDDRNTKVEMLIPIPIFDITNESVKNELYYHRRDIKKAQILGKENISTSITIYYDSDGNRYLQRKTIDKFNVNWAEPEVNVTYFSPYSLKYISKPFIKYNESLRMQIEKNAKGQVVFDKEKLIRKKDRKEIIVYKNDNGGLYITPSDATNIFGHVNSVFITDSDSKINYNYSKLSEDDLKILEEEYDINYKTLIKKDDGKFMEKTFDQEIEEMNEEIKNDLQHQKEELNKLREMLRQSGEKDYNNDYDYDNGQGYGM